MNSLHRKSKLNDDTPQVMIDEYKGHEDVPDNVTHVRFHPSVVEVRYEAFQERTELREVVLNDGLREIGKSAFQYCSALKSINVPSTVTKIDNAAFYNCKELREVVLNEGLTSIVSCAFSCCLSLQSITIPSSVLEIGSYAFINCTNLRDVKLNDRIKRIENSAFSECSSLQSITIPSTVTEIGPSAFYSCTNLQEVVLNGGIKKIWGHVFESCTSLQSITIPSTVIEVGTLAFLDCGSLQEVVIHNEKVQIEDKAFIGCISLERFKFPSLSTRLENIIQAGQRGIEAKMDDISAVEWRDGELVIPSVRREIENRLWGIIEVTKVDEEKLDKIVRLIRHYEIKEATTLFDWHYGRLGLINQALSNPAERATCRIEVPGPVKDAILQYIR